MKLSAAMERYLGSDACRRIQERFDKLYVRELPAGARAGKKEAGENMNVKMGESKISVVAEGCFRCGTSFSSGWYPLKVVTVRIGEKIERGVTLHVCNDCATPEEKVAPEESADSGLQRKLAV
jgi:hypothetical protein